VAVGAARVSITNTRREEFRKTRSRIAARAHKRRRQRRKRNQFTAHDGMCIPDHDGPERVRWLRSGRHCSMIRANSFAYPSVSGYSDSRVARPKVVFTSARIASSKLQASVRSKPPHSAAFHQASRKLATRALCPVSRAAQLP
jgi:hypothetical protein